MTDCYEVMAHYYDALAQARNTDKVRGDKKFYTEEALKSGGPVVEFGAGTLRISLEIAKAGIGVIAVDNSSEMHKIAAVKRMKNCSTEVQDRLEVTYGDMRDFSSTRKFPLAIITFRAFQNLLTPNDQRQCLENISRLLTAGGKLVFDIFDPRLETLAPNPQDAFGAQVRLLCTFANPEDESTVVVSLARTSMDRVEQTFSEQWIFDKWYSNGVMTRAIQELTLRWSYRYEIQYLLELCGFQVLNLFGDFSRAPFRYGEHQIWVAQKLG